MPTSPVLASVFMLLKVAKTKSQIYSFDIKDLHKKKIAFLINSSRVQLYVFLM